MSKKEIEKFWNDYCKEWGIEMDVPEDLADWLENFDEDEIAYRMAMGESYDSAIQSTMV